MTPSQGENRKGENTFLTGKRHPNPCSRKYGIHRIAKQNCIACASAASTATRKAKAAGSTNCMKHSASPNAFFSFGLRQPVSSRSHHDNREVGCRRENPFLRGAAK